MLYQTSVCLVREICFKGACSDPQPHSPIFSNVDILVPEVGSYLEGFMCEVSCMHKFGIVRRNL